jgi:hypothetical protein
VVKVPGVGFRWLPSPQSPSTPFLFAVKIALI